MSILVTGGAGFIGRWVVKKLVDKNYEAVVLDNLSNGRLLNIEAFKANKNFEFIRGDILDTKLLSKIFKENEINTCIHLAAQINVQESLDNPKKSFNSNVVGTYNILEECRRNNTKLVLVGTCMVYDLADVKKPIDENYPVKPKSPYAASKLAAENLAESYYYGYGLPVVILRPFNTYGPYQKSNLEGGVVSVFIERALKGEPLLVFGDGTQTRDLLYVEDCADFIVKSAFNDRAVGEIINAGYGKDITINELAETVSNRRVEIKHVPHHHPQSEIQRLVCDYSKAKRLLGWKPKVSLKSGFERTEKWIKKQLTM